MSIRSFIIRVRSQNRVSNTIEYDNSIIIGSSLLFFKLGMDRIKLYIAVNITHHAEL